MNSISEKSINSHNLLQAHSLDIQNIPYYKSKSKQKTFHKIHTNSPLYDYQRQKGNFKYIEKYIYKYFKNFYRSTKNDYNIRMIEDILNNESTHLVAEFKDYLIMGDITEFLQKSYNIQECRKYLPKIYEYYNSCSVIFPNYVTLHESKYIYKSIRKKQKVIDHQQEQEEKKEKIKKGDIKLDDEQFFSSKTFNSILDQTNTSNVKLFFGLNDNQQIDANETPNDIVAKLEEAEKDAMQRKMNLVKNKKKPTLVNNSNVGNNLNENSINNSNFYNNIINNSKIYIKNKIIKERSKNKGNVHYLSTQKKSIHINSSNMNMNNINNIQPNSNIIRINSYISKINPNNENNLSKRHIKSSLSNIDTENENKGNNINNNYITFYGNNFNHSKQKDAKKIFLENSNLKPRQIYIRNNSNHSNKNIKKQYINSLFPTKNIISKIFNNYNSNSILKQNSFNFINKKIANNKTINNENINNINTNQKKNINSPAFPLSPSSITIQANPFRKKYNYNLNINIKESNSTRNIKNNKLNGNRWNEKINIKNIDEKIKRNDKKNSLNYNSNTISTTITSKTTTNKERIKYIHKNKNFNYNKAQPKNNQINSNNINNYNQNFRTVGNNSRSNINIYNSNNNNIYYKNNYNYNNKNNEEIKLNEGDDKKMNKQIFPINLLIDNEIFYQIKYEETLTKNQEKEYNLKKEGAYCSTKCCFKNNIILFFILNIILFFFMIITAVFQVTSSINYNLNVEECQFQKKAILLVDNNNLLNPDLICSDSYYCNYYQYINGYCSYSRYHSYCNDVRFAHGCCNYYDHQVYLGKSFYCSYDNYRQNLCSYAQYDSRNAFFDFSFLENYENFQYIEGKIIYGCLLLDLISFLFMIIVISNEKKKISNKKEMIFKINFFLLFILYIIFAIICSLYCFICLYLIHFYYTPYYTIGDSKHDCIEEGVPLLDVVGEQSSSFIVCVLVFFMFGILKNIMISHINLEEKGNRDNTEKYRKTVFNIKEKELIIEIKLEDELCLKTMNNDNIYIFKKIKIPEIKKNDDIYIFINNKYIKDQISITHLNTYNMNEQVKRLFILSKLMFVVLIFIIYLFVESAKNSFSSSRYYDDSYYVYIYIELFLEICEFMIYLLMFLTYLYLFVKRILNGGIKTDNELKMNNKILNSFIVFCFICLFLNLCLITYESCLIGYNKQVILINYILAKVIIHLSFNFISFILLFVILFYNFKSKKYISEIKNDMDLFEKDLNMNIPLKFAFTDLKKQKHTLKPVIYKDYKINLFYELEGEKIDKNKINKIDKNEDSEVIINDASEY